MEEIDLKEIVSNISYLIAERDGLKLRNMLVDIHPADIADIIERLDDDSRNWLFSLLGVEQASDVIVELEEIAREDLIEDLGHLPLMSGLSASAPKALTAVQKRLVSSSRNQNAPRFQDSRKLNYPINCCALCKM